ncbi:GUN4 domain-containing protein [Nostoc sp. CENA67]|uniref:GUN4 domain-containing protein n=1 Tax=Amazonocrinis nigriterrae CENA67 TaxID=2794033 RepID=A0A8J7HK67_9NOST|nr:GUN4 domain-containing protein [Amazonocrinis nigriterrae]MBH8561028.1 GUN4 domain-containing protein [Amazonocrinis nigriterrae CENA67]
MVKNWALAIGINQYDFLQPLKYAKRDAKLIQEFFRNEAGFDRVFWFSDESPDLGSEPTRPYRANLLRLLQQLFAKPFMEAGDNFWFFFSGYGMVDANQDYLMPSDGDPEDIENTAISISDLTECLNRCGADNIVLILDACRRQHKNSGEGIGRHTQTIARQTGVISILSCSPDEYSYEIDALQKGVFTHALLEGLGTQGQCATVERLNQYLGFRVPQLAYHYQKARQTPHIIAEPIKSRLILAPKHATKHDISKLQIDAVQAEVSQNLELAEQLWIRVNAAASSSDIDAVKEIERIAQLRVEACATQKQLTPQIPSLNGSPLHENRKYALHSNLDGRSCNQSLGLGRIPTAKHQQKSTLARPDIAINDLNSERGIDYKPLHDLLAAGEWKQADRETLAVMLKIAGREKQGWLNIEAINQFPETDLYTIDQLWLKFSNGRFGFSVQKQIWESVGGQTDADYETWCKFCDRVGWRVNQNWLFYSDLSFDTDAPKGHFPAAATVNLLTVWRGWVVGLFSCLVGFSALALRLGKSH